MDALDLLADFASLLTCSAAKVEPIDARSKHENMASSVPQLSTTLNESSRPMHEQPLGVVSTGNWTTQPQNPSPTAVSQQTFLNQPSEVYNGLWDRQGNLENCEPQWSDGGHHGQFITEQLSIKGPPELFDYRYAPSWPSMYTFENNIPVVKNPRPPHQYARDLPGTEAFALPDYRSFESRCINDGCDCQAYDLRFPNTINGYMSTPMGEHRNAAATFRNSQVGRTYDPWMAMNMNEEQLRMSQAQHY